MNKNYIWYAAYGSNLLEERFLTYIKGGRCKINHQWYPGCTDKSLPLKNQRYIINHPIYFGASASSWEDGGVAFLDISHKLAGTALGRAYLITEEQFNEIQKQEGVSCSWYGRRVMLGELEEHHVITFTSGKRNTMNKPSDLYLEVMRKGIRETYKELKNKEIDDYLKRILTLTQRNSL